MKSSFSEYWYPEISEKQILNWRQQDYKKWFNKARIREIVESVINCKNNLNIKLIRNNNQVVITGICSQLGDKNTIFTKDCINKLTNP